MRFTSLLLRSRVAVLHRDPSSGRRHLKAFLRGAAQWQLPQYPELICAVTLGSSLALAWHCDSSSHEASIGVEPTHIYCWPQDRLLHGMRRKISHWGKCRLRANGVGEGEVRSSSHAKHSRRGCWVVALGKVHPHIPLLPWHVCFLFMALSARPNIWTEAAGKKLHPQLMVW